jgi:predicted RNA binding protein YcfA (HicA-like mRNA interferase family)
MTPERDIGRLVHLLRNTPVRELISAIERSGFVLQRTTRTGGHIYRHPEGRTVVVHYHRGSDTLTRGTLRNVVENTDWTEGDLSRLGLI